MKYFLFCLVSLFGLADYPVLPNEAGVDNTQYPVGDVLRYEGTGNTAVQYACDGAALTPSRFVDLRNGGAPLVFYSQVNLKARHSGLTVFGGHCVYGETGNSAPVSQLHMFYVFDTEAVVHDITFQNLVLDGNRAYFDQLGGNRSMRGVWASGYGSAFYPDRIRLVDVVAQHWTLTGATLDCTEASVDGWRASDCGSHSLNVIVSSADPSRPNVYRLNNLRVTDSESIAAISDNDAVGPRYTVATLTNFHGRNIAYGVKIQAHGSVTLRDGLVQGTTSHGIYCHSKPHGSVVFERIRVEDTGGAGFSIAAPGDYTWTDCEVYRGATGLQARSSGASLTTPTRLTLRGCRFRGASGSRWLVLFGGANPYATATLYDCTFYDQGSSNGIDIAWSLAIYNSDVYVGAGFYGLRVLTDARCRLHGTKFTEVAPTAHGINAQVGASVYASDWCSFSVTGTRFGGQGVYTLRDLLD